MSNTPCTILAAEHLSLDGVYQAPARSDEDTRDGFSHGGWTLGDHDPKMEEVVGKHMTGGWALLAGRNTYEDLYEGWHVRQPESPMTKALTNVQKFVVSRNASYKTPWANSTLLAGDAAETVARLKATSDKPLIIFGAGELVRSLIQRKLLDSLILMVHPTILGMGRRLFDGSVPFTKFEMVDKLITKTGVVVGTYKLA
jgi:dihydrofolate reductase